MAKLRSTRTIRCRILSGCWFLLHEKCSPRWIERKQYEIPLAAVFYSMGFLFFKLIIDLIACYDVSKIITKSLVWWAPRNINEMDDPNEVFVSNSSCENIVWVLKHSLYKKCWKMRRAKNWHSYSLWKPSFHFVNTLLHSQHNVFVKRKTRNQRKKHWRCEL